MEARFLRAALVVAAAILSAGAGRPYVSVRSQHFIVSAPTHALANEICQAAEQFRRDLAIEWLGSELPPWREICPIQADVAANLGAGGATSFVFRNGGPTEWKMKVQGSRERILDSVLPHEITHTIFASHFGRPLPRWADEGACTTVEHVSEKAKQDRFLVEHLTTDRGIPFNDMFRMKDYPHDILPLYSQGYSLAKFFIEQGGKQKFVEYVGEGMRTNNWTATTRRFYNFNSLSDLQLTWIEWVRAGSPTLPGGRVPDTLLVSAQVPSQIAGDGGAPQGAQNSGDDRRAQATAARPATAPRNAAPRNVLTSNVMANTQMASLTQYPQVRVPGGTRESWQTVGSQNARVFAQAEQFTSSDPAVAEMNTQTAATPSPEANFSTVSRPVSEGWYAKRRDQAQATLSGSASNLAASPASDNEVPPLPPQSNSISRIKAQPREPLSHSAAVQPATNGRVVMEWTRGANLTREDLTGVAANDRATTIR